MYRSQEVWCNLYPHINTLLLLNQLTNCNEHPSQASKSKQNIPMNSMLAFKRKRFRRQEVKGVFEGCS